MYKGSHVHIRRVTPDDAPLIFDWLQDATATRYRHGLLSICPNSGLLAERIALQLTIDPPLELEVLVLNATSATPIGIAGLTAIDPLNAKAELSLALLQGRGSRCFMETLAYIIERPFAGMGLHKIIFHVSADNEKVLEMMDRYNLTREGVLHEELVADNGQRLDLHRFALFHHDWEKHPLRKRLLQLFPGVREGIE